MFIIAALIIKNAKIAPTTIAIVINAFFIFASLKLIANLVKQFLRQFFSIILYNVEINKTTEIKYKPPYIRCKEAILFARF